MQARSTYLYQRGDLYLEFLTKIFDFLQKKFICALFCRNKFGQKMKFFVKYSRSVSPYDIVFRRVQTRVSWVGPKMSQLFDIAYYKKIERSHSVEKIEWISNLKKKKFFDVKWPPWPFMKQIFCLKMIDIGLKLTGSMSWSFYTNMSLVKNGPYYP